MLSNLLVCQCCGFATTFPSAFFDHISSTEDDPQHKEHYERCSRATRWSPQRCFCGGSTTTYTHGRGTDDIGWETVCVKCGYLWDED